MAKKYGMKNPETLFSIEYAICFAKLFNFLTLTCRYFKRDPKMYYKRGANLFADEYMVRTLKFQSRSHFN
jgi:hypothetical protein